MKTTLALLTLCLASCAPKAIVVEPITPKVAMVHASAKAASQQATVVQAAVKKTNTQASALVIEADRLRDETERLKTASGVTPEDLTSLWTMATALSENVKDHAATVREAVVVTDKSKELSVAVETGSKDLVVQATATDKQTVQLKQDKETMRDDAALGKSVKWIIGGLVVLLIIVFIILPLVNKILTVVKPL